MDPSLSSRSLPAAWFCECRRIGLLASSNRKRGWVSLLFLTPDGLDLPGLNSGVILNEHGLLCLDSSHHLLFDVTNGLSSSIRRSNDSSGGGVGNVGKWLPCPHLGAVVVSEGTPLCRSTAAILAQLEAALLVAFALVAGGAASWGRSGLRVRLLFFSGFVGVGEEKDREEVELGVTTTRKE